jgi:uncharacterized protein YxeA
MKKMLMILTTIIIVAIIAGLLWWYDYTKIMEKPIDIVKNGVKAFSVIDNVDNVVFTLYNNNEEIPKNVTTFYFENGVVSSAIYNRIYKNKRWAKGGLKEDYPQFYNRTLNANIVIGNLDVSIGETQSRIRTKINRCI